MSSPTEHTVRSSDGTEIGAIKIGSGRPLVFVHGAWNWHEHWMGVADQLSDSHTCWVMDRRGRATSGDGNDYSFDREIEDITAVLEEAGPDAALIGHSSGAIYCLETANREDVDRLVLYEPPLRWAESGHPDEMVERVRALVDAGEPESAAEMFFREEGRLDEDDLAALKMLPVWEPMVDLAPRCIREWDAILDAGLSVDRYQEMTTPTLLFAGGDNLDHEGMATEALSATLPDVRVSVLEGHRHRAHLTDPALVADEVRAFLH